MLYVSLQEVGCGFQRISIGGYIKVQCAIDKALNRVGQYELVLGCGISANLGK